MKIALLMSGGLGKFCYGSDNDKISNKWKDIVKNNNIDVFCVTDNNNFYDESSDIQYFSEKNVLKEVINGNSWRYYKKNSNIVYDDAKKKIQIILQKYFSTNLKKKLILDNDTFTIDKLVTNKYQKQFYDYTSGRSILSKYNVLCQFYKLKRCLELMKEYETENNINYDIIIRCRFDCIIESLKDVNVIRNLNFKNTIYTTGSEFHIYDWYIIGNYEIMNKICNYYNELGKNVVDNYKLFLYYDDNGKYIEYKKGYNIIKDKKYKIYHDVSDSSELGITYILDLNNYKYKTSLEFKLDREY